MALPFFPLQFPGLDVTGPIGQVLQILLTAFFIGFIFFGQKLQMRMFLMEIDRGLKRLDFIRIQARDLTLKTVKEQGKPTADITPQINTLMEQFIIAPVDMDPSGIVRKFDHLLDVHDVKFKDDVRAIAPGASEPR